MRVAVTLEASERGLLEDVQELETVDEAGVWAAATLATGVGGRLLKRDWRRGNVRGSRVTQPRTASPCARSSWLSDGRLAARRLT
jgi:hypothetical protein